MPAFVRDAIFSRGHARRAATCCKRDEDKRHDGVEGEKDERCRAQTRGSVILRYDTAGARMRSSSERRWPTRSTLPAGSVPRYLEGLVTLLVSGVSRRYFSCVFDCRWQWNSIGVIANVMWRSVRNVDREFRARISIIDVTEKGPKRRSRRGVSRRSRKTERVTIAIIYRLARYAYLELLQRLWQGQ